MLILMSISILALSAYICHWSAQRTKQDKQDRIEFISESYEPECDDNR
jgi:hypothetical protein